METQCEMSLLQHASSLLLNLQRLHLDSLFSDLQIFCDDGVIQSYRLVLGGCSELVKACLTTLHPDLEPVDTLILPGLTVTDLHTFHHCIYSGGGKISQAELETVVRVMVALGGDIRRYVQVNKQSGGRESEDSESTLCLGQGSSGSSGSTFFQEDIGMRTM